MQKILHAIRYFVSFVPGGQTLNRIAMNFVGSMSHRKKRRTLQDNGLAVCGMIHDVLSAAGISYFADHGTLLGLIRENGMIKHDTDMDFSVPPQESMHRIYSTLVGQGLKVVHGFSCNGEIAEVTFEYRGISMDFFRCHAIGDKLGHYAFVTKYDEKTGKFLGVMAHERIRPPLAGLETRTFGEKIKVKVSIPVNAVEYLAAAYGNWKIPDSKTDFSSDKIPTQYRDVNEGCRLLTADEIAERFL